MIIFLPCIMEQLQDADSDIRATALPIFSNLLHLLKEVKLSVMALELAGKLPALLNDVRMIGSPAHEGCGCQPSVPMPAAL